MFHWWWVYGALTAALLLWTSRPAIAGTGPELRRRGETFGAAAMLAVIWLLSNLGHWFLDPYQQFFTVVDYVAVLGMLWVWRANIEVWKLVLVGLFLATWPFHWSYIAKNDNSHAAKYAYDLALNLIYLGQLATVFVASRPLRRFG